MDKFTLFVLIFALVSNILPKSEAQTAPRCPVEGDAETCDLPDCRCSSTSIPGGLDRSETPQVNKYLQLVVNIFYMNNALIMTFRHL